MKQAMAEELYQWTCGKCRESGVVRAAAGTDVLSVEARIRSQHHHISPACADDWGASYVTVDQAAPLPD